MSGKKILHVFPSFAVGGVQVRFCNIVNDPSDNNEHWIISILGDTEAKKKLNSRANVNFVSVPDLKKMGFFARLKVIRQVIEQIAPDVVMTYNWGAIEWSLVTLRLVKLPLVHWEDGFGPDEKDRLKPQRNVFRSLVLRGKVKVVVPSQNLYRIARKQWYLPDRSMVYFPNGIALPTSEQLAAKKAQSDTVVIGTLATIRAEKNIPRLIDAVASLPDHVHLLVGGDGPVLQQVNDYVKQHKLEKKVTLAGHVSDVFGFMQQLDIFAISSDTEQMPISLLEAMAMKLPCVCTNVGDIKAMVSDENLSFVVDFEQFSARLCALVKQPSLWSDMGNANYTKCVTQYSFTMMMNNFKGLIN